MKDIKSFVDLVLSYPSNQNNSLKIALDIARKNKSITEGFMEYIKEKMRDVERSGGNQPLLWKLRAMYLVLSGNEEEINSSVYDLIANRELFESEAGYFFVEVISLVIKAYSKWPDVIYAVIKKKPMNELTRKFISRYDFMYQDE